MRAFEFLAEEESSLTLIDAIRDFLPIAIKELKLKSLPKINFAKDVQSKHDQPTFGKYENQDKEITLDIENRHPVDIIRTLAHELVHYKQDLEGRLDDNSWITGSPEENEAHEVAGVLMREFDKHYKKYLAADAVTLEEGWKDWVAGAGAAAMLAGGGGAAYDAYKAHQAEKEPTPIVAKADVKKNDFKKGIEKLSKDAVPKQLVTGSPHEKFLTGAAVAAGIKGEELAQFLGQTAHESNSFKTMVEYGDSDYFKKYEPKFLKDKKTKKWILDPKTKRPKNFNPKSVTLGNTMPGDGEKYKGRGYIQLTGKYNYEQASKALGLDLVKNPQLVEKPEVAAKVAVWFWQNRVQPKVHDFGDTAKATKPINPGLKHLDKRKEKFKDFKVAMR